MLTCSQLQTSRIVFCRQYRAFCREAMQDMYTIICQNVNKEAVAVAKENPSSGLFYNKSMTKSWENVDAMIVVHEELLKALVPYNLGNKRLELQEALKKFNSLQQNSLFDVEDENASNSLRNQAAGIKLMMSRLTKKKNNMKDGTRSKQVFRSMFTDSFDSSPKLSPCGSEASDQETTGQKLQLSCICHLF